MSFCLARFIFVSYFSQLCFCSLAPGDDDLSDSGSESLDMFADIPQNSDSEDDTSTNPRYNDFFDALSEVNVSKKTKKVKFDERVTDRYPGNDNDFSDDSKDAVGDIEEDDDSDEEMDDSRDMQFEDNVTVASNFGPTSVPKEEDIKKELSTHEKKLTKVCVCVLCQQTTLIVFLLL